MPTLIYEYAVHVNKDGEYESYWPEMWSIEYLASVAKEIGAAFFAAGFQNDPAGLDGNILKGDWLRLYHWEELAAMRQQHGRGVRYAGVDPAQGGVDVDSDLCAGFMIEVFENKHGFAIDHFMERLPIEKQAQYIEDWLDRWDPHFTIVEDTSAKGYVYNAMVNSVNNGAGTKHPVQVRQPQSKMAVGNKVLRFLHMAPWFENGNVRLPGVTEGDRLAMHPNWEDWANQWKAFPGGHDDGLDAAFWAVTPAFSIPGAAAAHKRADGEVVSTDGETFVEPVKVQTVDRGLKVPTRETMGKPIPRLRPKVGGFRQYFKQRDITRF